MYTKVIMSHALDSETGMPVGLLKRLENTANSLLVHVNLKGHDNVNDTLYNIHRVNDDVPQHVLKFLNLNSAPKN